MYGLGKYILIDTFYVVFISSIYIIKHKSKRGKL